MKRRRQGHERDEQPRSLEKVMEVAGELPPGMSRLGEPAFLLDTGWPDALTEAYLCFDGAELFHEDLVLLPASRVKPVRRDDPGATAEERGATHYRVGEIEGDELLVDDRGRVWRREEDSGEWLPEGSRFDRWLLGAVEAQRMLYDRDGEFTDDAFDDSGELTAAMSERMCRRILKRDRAAPAPRWRLARAMAQQGKLEAAREQLETVVAESPDFAWAWFDLARIGEGLGELASAVDEMEAAATARPGYEHAAYFWAQAARLARSSGDEARRAACAREALALDPELAASQRDGARVSLEDGELEAAQELAENAAALAPRDLLIMDLLARIRAQIDARQPPA